jgi:hypothetical protein
MDLNSLMLQIDEAAAAACQSADASIKGGYLWQNFPQVRGCADYNAALMLLAQEKQAALIAAQGAGFGGVPHQGFGQAQPTGYGGVPQQGFGQPQASYGGAPQQGFGQATPAGFGQATPAGFGQATQQGFGQTQAGFGQQPQAGFGQAPQQGFGQPQAGYGQQQDTTPAGAAQFAGYKPPADVKPGSDKILGILPKKYVAMLIVGAVLLTVVILIGVNIRNAFRTDTPNVPAVNNGGDLWNAPDDPFQGLFD